MEASSGDRGELHVVGFSRAALEATVAFAKQRREFGQPISAFQAASHQLAEMSVRLESMRDALRDQGCADFKLPERAASVSCKLRPASREAACNAAARSRRRSA